MSTRAPTASTAFIVLLALFTGLAGSLLLLQLGMSGGAVATLVAGSLLATLLGGAVVDAIRRSRQAPRARPPVGSASRSRPVPKHGEQLAPTPVVLEDERGLIVAMARQSQGHRDGEVRTGRDPRTRWVPLLERPSGRPRRSVGSMVGVLILAAGAWIVFSLTVSTRWEGYVVPAEGMVTGAQEAAAARMAIGSFRSRAGCYEALQEFADASSYESDNFVLRCESSRSFMPF